ncbi:LacI family transcriptional regulator [Opitutaceae bacterium TAV5]|nr:LacI family transcriptional regulator [Opitutaceae bacterium TAV5]
MPALPHRRITLGHIAREAGVSRAAVSYALRGDPNIAAETRRRIQEIATRLGYRPDPMLSKLMTHLHGGSQRGGMSESEAPRYEGKIAFINPRPEEKAFSQRAHGLKDFYRNASERARALGYELEEFWLHEPGITPARLAGILMARGIRGIVLGSSGHPDSEVDFPWKNFAAVTVGYSVTRPVLHRVATHHYHNTLLALRKVTEAGYRRVGLLLDRPMEPTMENLHLAAFLAWQYGQPEESRVPPAFSGSGTKLQVWFRERSPEVLLHTTPGTRASLASWGLPPDLPLVSLLRWETGDPDMAGVRPGYERLGAVAVNLLVSQLHHDEYGLPEEPRIVLVDGQWVNGASLPPKQKRQRRQ